MFTSKKLLGTLALSSALFSACRRDITPEQYLSEPSKHSKEIENASFYELKDLAFCTQDEPPTGSRLNFIPANTLVTTRAWVCVDPKAEATTDDLKSICYKVYLNALGPDYSPYKMYAGPLVHASLYLRRTTEVELEELNSAERSRDMIDRIHKAVEYREYEQNRRMHNGEFNCYAEIIGFFSQDGEFKIIRLEPLPEFESKFKFEKNQENLGNIQNK